jgi:predicted DNA-binding transcriptional regulator AlpA
MKLLPEPGFMRIQKFIGEIFPMSKSTYYRGVKAGRLPAPVSLTPNISGIPHCEINKCILKLQEVSKEEAP